MINIVLRFVCGLAAALVLVGCGGGGDDGSIDGVDTTFSKPILEQLDLATIERTINALNSRPVSLPFVISGQVSSTPITGNGILVNLTPVSSTFEGAPALIRNESANGTYFAGNKSYPFTSSSTNYTDATFNPVGSISTGQYTVLKQVAPKSSQSAIGGPGIIFDGKVNLWWTGDIYTNSTKAVKIGTKTISVGFNRGINPVPDSISFFTKFFDLQSKLTKDSFLEVELDSKGAIIYKRALEKASNGDIIELKF